MINRKQPLTSHLLASAALVTAVVCSGCPVNAIPTNSAEGGGGGSTVVTVPESGGTTVTATVTATDYTTASTDSDSNNLIGSNTIRSTFVYDRTNDNSSSQQLSSGVDPNWYNGVTRMRGAYATTGALNEYWSSTFSGMSALATRTTYTEELWFNINALDAVNTRYLPIVSEGGGNNITRMYIDTSGKLVCYMLRADGIARAAVGTTTLVAKKWYHGACVYDGSNLYTYLNGQLDVAPTAVTEGLYRGLPGGTFVHTATTATTAFDGRMSEIRISNTARYTPTLNPTGFTPSTRFESDVNTLVLLHGDDGPGNSTIYNAALDTINTSAGGYFADGQTTNYLRRNNHAALIPTNRMTMETWVYLSQYPTLTSYLIYKSTNYTLEVRSTGRVYASFISSGFVVSGVTDVIPLNQWTHVAATYDDGDMNIFINGTLVGTSSGATAAFGAATHVAIAWGGGVPMYVDEVRIMTDVAYTANFTPKRRLVDLPNTGLMYHFDETSGLTATDSSGNGLDGSVQGTPGQSDIAPMAHTTGDSTNPTAVLYDNNTAPSGIQIADNATLDVPAGTAITLEGWAYKSTAADQGYIIQKSSAYALRVTNTEGASLMIWQAGAWATCSAAAGTVPLRTWTHIAGTYDPVGDEAKIYINGTLENTCTGGTWGSDVPDSASPVYIGSNADPMGGLIDEPRITFALVYTADFTPRRTLPYHANAALHYHFNDAAGSATVQDGSQNNNDGSIIGAPNAQIYQINTVPTSFARTGTPRIFPTAPFVTTGCENITYSGGLDDDAGIEIWITRGGSVGYAQYQWRKIGGANWANAFSGSTTTNSALTALGASGVNVAFAANSTWTTDDHCIIQSWALENGANEGVANTKRGTRDTFPERALIMANGGGVDVIDTTTTPHSLWMHFDVLGTRQSAIGVTTTTETIVNNVEFLNGRMYVGLYSQAADYNSGLYVIDFTRDRAEMIHQGTLSFSFGGVTAPRGIASRNTASGDAYVGNAQGAYARGANVLDPGPRKISVGNAIGKQWAALASRTSQIYLLDEYNHRIVNFYDTSTANKMYFAKLVKAAGGGSLELIYTQMHGDFMGVYPDIENIAADTVSGASSQGRIYSFGGSPGTMTGNINDVSVSYGTSTVTGYNTLYVAQDTGVTVIHEGLTTGASDSFQHVLNATSWPWNAGGYLNFASGNRVVVNNNAAFGLTSDMTVEAWFRSSSVGVNRDMVSFYDWSGGRGYFLLISNSERPAFYVGATQYPIIGTVNDGEWHHVAAVISGTTLRMYLDGKLERSFTIALAGLTTTDSPALCIGGRASSSNACANGNNFIGDIDEVRISNVARYSGTAPGVPSGPFTADANTIALFHMNEGAGATTAVEDSAGSSTYTGNISGATWTTRTNPTYDYDHAADLANNVVSVNATTDGGSLFVGVNSAATGESGLLRIRNPGSTTPLVYETFTATSSPELISERITASACMMSDTDVVVTTPDGYTILNYGAF